MAQPSLGPVSWKFLLRSILGSPGEVPGLRVHEVTGGEEICQWEGAVWTWGHRVMISTSLPSDIGPQDSNTVRPPPVGWGPYCHSAPSCPFSSRAPGTPSVQRRWLPLPAFLPGSLKAARCAGIDGGRVVEPRLSRPHKRLPPLTPQFLSSELGLSRASWLETASAPRMGSGPLWRLRQWSRGRD